MMFFQGRGTLHLQPIIVADDGSETLGKAINLCTDSLNIALSTDSWTHHNKCGTIDVEDARGIKSQSASMTMALADMQDKIFALGILGMVNAAGSPGTVASEELPQDLGDGDVWFLGGKTRHRAITGLVISGMTVTTDYTLDAETGKVTFVGDQSASPAPTAAYGYTDPAYVSMFTNAQLTYFASYEFINKQNANAKGSLELYKVRFDPTDNADFQSDEAMIMTFKGSALADTTRDADTELGQFGRRIL